MLRQDSAVREASADRFRRILVDEFQDTDPIQTEIVFLLTGSGNPGEPWYKRRLLPRPHNHRHAVWELAEFFSSRIYRLRSIPLSLARSRHATKSGV